MLCSGRLPDGLPQVPLSKAVHGGADDLRSGLCHQNLRLYRRVPGAGNPGSAAGHQPFRGLLHRRGRRHPLRPRRGEKRRPRSYPFHGGQTGGGRRFPLSGRFSGTDGGGRAEQARRGKLYKMRRDGLFRLSPQRTSGSVRPDDGQRVRLPEEESGRADGSVRHAGRGRRGGQSADPQAQGA